MEQAYRKYMLNMKNESEGFNLWKEDIEVKCRIETYKEKRIYFN